MGIQRDTKCIEGKERRAVVEWWERVYGVEGGGRARPIIVILKQPCFILENTSKHYCKGRFCSGYRKILLIIRTFAFITISNELLKYNHV